MSESRLQTRKSNIELLRIVLMLLIIAHHLVVNSGLTEMYDYQSPTLKMYFFQCFGAFGKVGVNCFMLITGYFMVTSEITMKKWLKLFLEVKFYTISIYLLFLVFGRISFNYHQSLETLFSVVFGVGVNYADTFLVLYLLIPFLNVLARKLEFRAFSVLLGIALTVMTIIPTFSLFLSVLDKSNDTWNYLMWMIVLYLTGAYIRSYQDQFLDRIGLKMQVQKILLPALNLLAVFLWIAFYDLFGVKHDMGSPYWFVNDANKLLAFTCAVSLLLCFLSLDIKHSKIINGVASTTFGVFLIHTSGDYMRSFLWSTVFKVPEIYLSQYAAMKVICVVLMVFVTCALIDVLRQIIIEKPLLSRLPVIDFLSEKCYKNWKSKRTSKI